MAISEGYKTNYTTLCRAFENGDVCLLECTEKATGKIVVALCAVEHEGGGDVTFVPLAKMFDGDPYDELNPPY